MTAPTVEVTANPAPGPGSRVTRTAGQLGGAGVLFELWLAFGWFGADTWTERQVLAVYATLVFAVATLQNLVGWWREERTATPHAVTVEAVGEGG